MGGSGQKGGRAPCPDDDASPSPRPSPTLPGTAGRATLAGLLGAQPMAQGWPRVQATHAGYKQPIHPKKTSTCAPSPARGRGCGPGPARTLGRWSRPVRQGGASGGRGDVASSLPPKGMGGRGGDGRPCHVLQGGGGWGAAQEPGRIGKGLACISARTITACSIGGGVESWTGMGCSDGTHINVARTMRGKARWLGRGRARQGNAGGGRGGAASGSVYLK